MPNKLRIALAQTSPANPPPGLTPTSSEPFANIVANLAEIAEWTASAADQGADVVVFPEYCVQGIFGKKCLHLCFPHEAILTELKSLAKQYKVALVGTILVGSPHESLNLPSFPVGSLEGEEWKQWLSAYTADETTPPTMFNQAFFIDDNGEMIGSYHKRNLWHPEREIMTAGQKENEVFQTKWGKAALLICWDISHPMAGQTLSDQGVELVFMPTYWKSTDSEPILSRHAHEADYEMKMVKSWCFARAVETETVWAMCNPGGRGEDEFMGGSGVWQPLRGLIDGFDRAEVGMKVVEVDVDELKDAKEVYKIREDYCRMYPGRVGPRSGV